MSSLDKNLAAVSSEARLVLIGLDCVKVQKLVILVRVQIDPCMPPLLSTGQPVSYTHLTLPTIYSV